VHRFSQGGAWKWWVWTCVLLLITMNSAQVMHLCGLTQDLGSQTSHDVSLSGASANHTFCTICATSHSPSLASPVASPFAADGPAEVSLPARTIERTVAPVLLLYVRPPPIFWRYSSLVVRLSQLWCSPGHRL